MNGARIIHAPPGFCRVAKLNPLGIALAFMREIEFGREQF